MPDERINGKSVTLVKANPSANERPTFVTTGYIAIRNLPSLALRFVRSSGHPKEVVVLSDYERKTLREVECQLMLEDAEFALSFHNKIAIVVAVLLSALLSSLVLIAGLLSGALTFGAAAGLIWMTWRYSDRRTT